LIPSMAPLNGANKAMVAIFTVFTDLCHQYVSKR